MNAEDRLADLERRVAALESRSDSIDRAERRLLDAARQWARMTQLGHYIEDDGTICRVGQSDRSMFADGFLDQMRRASLDLLDLEAKPR